MSEKKIKKWAEVSQIAKIDRFSSLEINLGENPSYNLGCEL